jgi:hypothetical protein
MAGIRGVGEEVSCIFFSEDFGEEKLEKRN